MSSALILDDIYYLYPSNWMGKKKPALNGISLSVEQGESFGFLGLNGAGKTTTIKSILGLIPLSKGSVSILGFPHTRAASRHTIGYLPEHPYFYDHLSVRELLNMYASLANVPLTSRDREVTRVLERVGIIDKQFSRMRNLSKGQTQRVGLAQAIVANPKLLILDEPFSGLDPLGRKEFREIMGELKRAGTTIFMSSHILPDVEFLCDRVSIIVKGTLKGVYSTDELSQSLQGSYEIIARADQSVCELITPLADESNEVGRMERWTFRAALQAEKALRILLEKGSHIEHYGFQRIGLEQYFLNIVKGASNEA
jgi:ABC-2 type transport system ATP-binding protein